MSKKKTNYSVEFKTKLVIEVLKNEQTLNQIASKYKVLSRSLQMWKKQFLTNASLAFEPNQITKEYKEKIKDKDKEIEDLQKQLGKHVIEKEWALKKLKSLDLINKKEIIDFKLNKISITKQCKLLDLSRSSIYYKSKPMNENDLKILSKIEKIYEYKSFFGYRNIHKKLINEEREVIGENRVLKYMKILGIRAIFPEKKQKTTFRNKEHKIYPYLLKGLEINKPNQVWSGDITYIPINGGTIYFAGIIDWCSRSILSWRLSNTMDSSLIIDTFNAAVETHGSPEIFNSDKGSQYTSKDYTQLLKDMDVKISMNGKRGSVDNVIIERFFRSLKYEDIYLKKYCLIKEAKEGINEYINFYNFERYHSSLNYKTPMSMYLKTSDLV